MAVSLKDIAKKAGVHVSTVSKALSDNAEINIDTKRKIKKIADELNYVPNYRAQALVNQKTKTIGVVVPYLNNFYYSELTQAIKDGIQEDYRVSLYSKDNIEEEFKHIKAFKSGEVDGAVFVWAFLEHIDEFKELGKQIPLVFIGNHQVELTKAGSIVRCDLQEGGYQLTKHIIELGHKKIGYIGNEFQRYQGFLQAMKEFKIPINNDFLFLGPYDLFEAGLNIGKEIIELSEKPTGIVCINDEVAIGAASTLIKEGFKIPEDISIGGNDNTDFSKYYNPPLTSVRISKKKVGLKAAEIIKNKLNDDIPENQLIIYPPQLIKRESTAVFEN